MRAKTPILTRAKTCYAWSVSVMQTIKLARVASGLARNPLGFLTVWYVSCCVVLGAVLVAGMRVLHPALVQALGWSLIVYPMLALGVFCVLTIRHHVKLYAPHDFREEGNFTALGRAGGSPPPGHGADPGGDDFAIDVVEEVAAARTHRDEPTHEPPARPAHWARFRARLCAMLAAGHRPRGLTGTVSGEDFQLIVGSPSANREPRLSAGVYVTEDAVYHVSRQQQIFRIFSATSPAQMVPVKVLPNNAVIVSGRYDEPALEGEELEAELPAPLRQAI